MAERVSGAGGELLDGLSGAQGRVVDYDRGVSSWCVVGDAAGVSVHAGHLGTGEGGRDRNGTGQAFGLRARTRQASTATTSR